MRPTPDGRVEQTDVPGGPLEYPQKTAEMNAIGEANDENAHKRRYREHDGPHGTRLPAREGRAETPRRWRDVAARGVKLRW